MAQFWKDMPALLSANWLQGEDEGGRGEKKGGMEGGEEDLEGWDRLEST